MGVIEGWTLNTGSEIGMTPERELLWWEDACARFGMDLLWTALL